MKVEIEIPDLEEIYYACGYEEDTSVTGQDIKQAIADIAIKKIVEQMYEDYVNDRWYESVYREAKDIVKEHSTEIVNKIIERVSNEIMRKKAIVNEMPKRNEVTNISKEWEEYFIELIDKAIAKRFK